MNMFAISFTALPQSFQCITENAARPFAGKELFDIFRGTRLELAKFSFGGFEIEWEKGNFSATF